jgi:uncharacterized membrane protein
VWNCAYNAAFKRNITHTPSAKRKHYVSLKHGVTTQKAKTKSCQTATHNSFHAADSKVAQIFNKMHIITTFITATTAVVYRVVYTILMRNPITRKPLGETRRNIKKILKRILWK